MTSPSKATLCGGPLRSRRVAALCAASAFLLAGCSAQSETSGAAFNGAWNLISADGARIAWLKVEGADSERPVGWFVMGTAGGGGGWYKDLGISIGRGELRFRVRRGGESTPRPDEWYTARLVDGKLEGVCRIEGGAQPAYQWTGERSPSIQEHDDGTWRPVTPIVLFDGEDLAGWRVMFPDRDAGWEARAGILSNTSRWANNLVSEQKFWNFVLHAEYRLARHCDSGIGLRGRYEVSIMDDAAGGVSEIAHGAIFSRIAPSRNVSRPAGEWQTLDVRLVGREVTVSLNGERIIERREIEGLTGIASDPNEPAPGPITIQGDHGMIEFRRITVSPLVRAPGAGV